MHFHVVTIFPQMFDSYLNESILARAIKEKKIKIDFYNPLKFCPPKKRIDDRPYGGGPGMVLRPEPMIKSIEQAIKKIAKKKNTKIKIINFAPAGEKFTTSYAKNLVTKKYTDIIFISGRYEGIDARVKKIFKAEDVSVGDYVLTGGELPAMVLIDCISRQVKGVLGKYESLEEERVSSGEIYTRPEVLEYPFSGKNIQNKKIKKYKVPKVLLSGNHKDIDEWKNSHR